MRRPTRRERWLLAAGVTLLLLGCIAKALGAGFTPVWAVTIAVAWVGFLALVTAVEYLVKRNRPPDSPPA